PITLTGARLLYLPTQTETDANLRRLQCGSQALSRGRRVYLNAIPRNVYRRRYPLEQQRGMQRPPGYL
ncbi:MAG: hypothetical protein WBZ19_26385, partial [Chthoniobacterales bacterium]